jgi:hypothetical protein
MKILYTNILIFLLCFLKCIKAKYVLSKLVHYTIHKYHVYAASSHLKNMFHPLNFDLV